jgi:hypothetical protein
LLDVNMSDANCTITGENVAGRKVHFNLHVFVTGWYGSTHLLSELLADQGMYPQLRAPSASATKPHRQSEYPDYAYKLEDLRSLHWKA